MLQGFSAVSVFCLLTISDHIYGCPVAGIHFAFSAYRDSPATYGLDQIVLFDRIFTNDGGAYCNDTGIFTAPISGTYFFTWTISSFKKIITGIAVNRDYKAQVVNDGHAYTFASNSVVLKLDEGDTVFIGVQLGSEIFSDSTNKWYYPTFSGYLLYV